MITLHTRAARYVNITKLSERSIYRVETSRSVPNALRSRLAFIFDGGEIPSGFGIYILIESLFPTPNLSDSLPFVVVPESFAYLSAGDIIKIDAPNNALRTLFRKHASANGLLLTERCNNYCLMCSQPPRKVNDSYLFHDLVAMIELIDHDPHELVFSGGEPTLLGDHFIELVRSAKSYLPRTAIHVLSNGRNFADYSLAEILSSVAHPDLMIGIPLYSDISYIHDYVVQADGAYDETIRGILNLKKAGVAVEIRVVLHKQTVPRLKPLAEFITRNLLFVDQVVLMGLEITGFTKVNFDELWIDPADYIVDLREAVGVLTRAKIKTSIYNTQLCLLPEELRPLAKKSISDWKREYLPVCGSCSIKHECGGFFSFGQERPSRNIAPVVIN